VSSLEFAEGTVPSPGKLGPISVAPSRSEHRSDVRNRSTTNRGLVSVLRSREAAISRGGEFYWILLAATEDLSDKFLLLRGRQPGLGSHVLHVVNKTSIRLNQLETAVDFIFPLSPTSPTKAGSQPLSPLLIQLRTVSKMIVYDERLGDDAMGMQGRRASLAGVLAGGVGFMSCVLLCASLLILPLSTTSPSKAGSHNPPPPRVFGGPIHPFPLKEASLLNTIIFFCTCVCCL